MFKLFKIYKYYMDFYINDFYIGPKINDFIF